MNCELNNIQIVTEIKPYNKLNAVAFLKGFT